ncbi:hypothetical protein ACFUTX_11105 [Microbacterium sp. NPDC057407]|uniref:hypothetical protein n=1 Tax=Microbacterium sp. NPDC057407 TaxID=3346120 RepID=UPI0036700D63
MALERFKSVRTLVIASYPEEDLTPVQGLTQLEYLSVTHLPKVSDLAPLDALSALRTLRLATLPSWDSYGRVTSIRSLRPLAHMPALKHLELFGVVPEDRSLSPLEGSGTLRSVRVSKYPGEEVQRFRNVTSIEDAWAPKPSIADWRVAVERVDRARHGR